MKSTESMDLPKNARNHSDTQLRWSLWLRAICFKKCCMIMIPCGLQLWFRAFLCLIHVLAETLLVYHRLSIHFSLWYIIDSFCGIIVIPSIVFSIHTHSTQSAPPRTLHALVTLQRRLPLPAHYTPKTYFMLWEIGNCADRTYSVLYHKRYIHPTHCSGQNIFCIVS